MADYHIRQDDLSGPEVTALLEFHLAEMYRWSPPESVHAMPVERLRQPDVSFFSAWEGDTLAAVGAIKELDPTRGELKSMRAAPEYRGKGAGQAILLHLMAEAERRGYGWLGLETGRPEPFQPAQALYRKHGFTECAPFGDYVSDDFSICMERTLLTTLLRPATASDAEALSELGRESFIAAFGHLYRPEDLEAFLAEYRTPQAFRSHIADPPTLIQVADVGGRLAAYSLIVRGHLMEGRPDPQPQKPVYLSQLYCAGDMTGHGLGAALIEWAIAEARNWGADVLQLSVFSENFGAQRFYQRHGFRKVADIDFWVGNHRDDEFLYELEL